MLEALASLFTLRYTNPSIHHPLPDKVNRTFISSPLSPDEQLELLASNATSSSTPNSPPPSLFLHGGFGSASVWLPTLTHLRDTLPGTPAFALSMRGHGASYSVPYIRMVFGTTLSDLASDIVLAVEHIKVMTGRTPILIAHSSTGGVVQWILANKLATTPALILVDAVPVFGNLGVYANWARQDPWFELRILLHAGHPISPLSSLSLVRGVFFGDGKGTDKSKVVSDDEISEFVRWMPRYESLTWPMQMAGSFWGWLTRSPKWLDVKDVLAGVVGGKEGAEKVCVLTGGRDVIMDVEMCRRVAEEYRNGIEELKEEKNIDDGTDVVTKELNKLEGGVVESRGGVRFVVINGAGHHVQNDVQWKVAAEALRHFVEQI